MTTTRVLHYVTPTNANASVTHAACGEGIVTRALPATYTERPENATCRACVAAIAATAKATTDDALDDALDDRNQPGEPRVIFPLGPRAEEILGADSERYPGLKSAGRRNVSLPLSTAWSLVDDAAGRASGLGYDSEPGERAAMARVVKTLGAAIATTERAAGLVRFRIAGAAVELLGREVEGLRRVELSLDNRTWLCVAPVDVASNMADDLADHADPNGLGSYSDGVERRTARDAAAAIRRALDAG